MTKEELEQECVGHNLAWSPKATEAYLKRTHGDGPLPCVGVKKFANGIMLVMNTKKGENKLSADLFCLPNGTPIDTKPALR